MTKSQKRDVATSFTTLVFLVVGTTGVLMYFHLFDNYTKALHEILGLFFVAVVVFHVFFNFASMKNYFSKNIFYIATVLTLGFSAVFISMNSTEGPNPKGELIGKMLGADINNSFAVLGVENGAAFDKLQAAGVKVDGFKTINEMAKANKKSPFEIVSIVIK